MRLNTVWSLLGLLCWGGLAGCGGTPPAQPMAPPVTQAAPPVTQAAPPGMAGSPEMGAPQSAGVFNWQDVPVGQQVPIRAARFDQGGYQIYAASGETIVVPFINNNLYVLKFGRTNGGNYFVNQGDVPILYLRPDSYLENAMAQNARWYPIPADYAYSRPVYVSMAPSWGDFLAMGWYTGMVLHGGMWGYTPRAAFVWMPSYSVVIGGARYNDYTSYRSYYNRNPSYTRTRTVYNNYNVQRGANFGSSRSRTFNSATGGGMSRPSSGFFGTRQRPSNFGGGFGNRNGSTFGNSSGSSGNRNSFGSSNGPSFGNRLPSGSSSDSSFGGNRSVGGGNSSFGGSSGSFNTGRSSSSSFGGGRSFGGGGGSFGGGRSYGGGSSFGGSSTRSTRSSGSSFGGSRRR